MMGKIRGTLDRTSNELRWQVPHIEVCLFIISLDFLLTVLELETLYHLSKMYNLFKPHMLLPVTPSIFSLEYFCFYFF